MKAYSFGTKGDLVTRRNTKAEKYIVVMCKWYARDVQVNEEQAIKISARCRQWLRRVSEWKKPVSGHKWTGKDIRTRKYV
jgi:hypothetical protein